MNWILFKIGDNVTNYRIHFEEKFLGNDFNKAQENYKNVEIRNLRYRKILNHLNFYWKYQLLHLK